MCFSVYEPPIVAEIDDTFFTGGHGAIDIGQLSGNHRYTGYTQ